MTLVVSKVPEIDDIARTFNTALVGSRVNSNRDFSSELATLVQSSAFQVILSSVKQLSRLEGISEREAAEKLIQTFRKLDQTWSDYVFKEGVDRLRS
jgi:hypothetical protein